MLKSRGGSSSGEFSSRGARIIEQSTLGTFETNLSVLTEVEREVYVAVVQEDIGVRELEREPECRPGTVGHLLKRAGLRLSGRQAKVPDTDGDYYVGIQRAYNIASSPPTWLTCEVIITTVTDIPGKSP